MGIERNTKLVPTWRRSPASVKPPTGIEDFINRSNAYFEECADTDTRPTVTGYAVAVGLPGPTSLIRLGQRMPQLRYAISQCLTIISLAYEEMIGSGNAAGPLFMLKNIPDFDPDEQVGSPPALFFNERKEIALSVDVVGAMRVDKEFDNEDPLDTYIRIIKQKGEVIKQEEEENITKVFTQKVIPARKALTIISEGWDSE